MLLYSDDMFVLFPYKDLNVIEKNIWYETNIVYECLKQNNLIINLKARKTEYMLFVSPKKLTNTLSYNLKVYNIPINRQHVTIDCGLSMSKHLNHVLKKANFRIKLLSRLRYTRTVHAEDVVYRNMVLPIFLKMFVKWVL